MQDKTQRNKKLEIQEKSGSGDVLCALQGELALLVWRLSTNSKQQTTVLTAYIYCCLREILCSENLLRGSGTIKYLRTVKKLFWNWKGDAISTQCYSSRFLLKHCWPPKQNNCPTFQESQCVSQTANYNPSRIVSWSKSIEFSRFYPATCGLTQQGKK